MRGLPQGGSVAPSTMSHARTPWQPKQGNASIDDRHITCPTGAARFGPDRAVGFAEDVKGRHV
eukprot:3460020-Pyramimonas_sp.AAC.1